MLTHQALCHRNDIMNIFRIVLCVGIISPVAVLAAEQNDLREFRIGMAVSALPDAGYGEFACAGDSARTLLDWRDFRSCSAASDGTRGITFRYEDGRQTQVGGQSVNLALLIDGNDRVSGIRIDTDPSARLYQHKRAYLFAQQVRARFGDDGWKCSNAAPTPTEQPIGGAFYDEHCEKVTPSRHFVLNRQLYHDPNRDIRDFTDATQFTIQGAE
jgi:hypothetical protein